MSLVLYPFEWAVVDGVLFPNEDGELERTCVVRCWAWNEDNQTVLLHLPHAPVIAYLQLPKGGEQGFEQVVGALRSLLVQASWRAQRRDDDQEEDGPALYELERATLVHRNLLHFYDPDRTGDVPFLELRFNTRAAMMALKNILPPTLEGRSVKLHETEVDIVRRKLSVRNTKFAGWFKVQGARPIEKRGAVNPRYHRKILEWSADWRTLAPTTSTAVVNPLILVFDLEVNSGNNMFPNSALARDEMFVVSAISWRARSPEKARVQALYTGFIDGPGDAPLEGYPGRTIERYACRDEAELITKFQEVIAEVDPDVISGYNIGRFDIPYFCTRARLLGKKLEGFARTAPHDRERVEFRSRLRETQKAKDNRADAGAFFDQELVIPGRIVFDLFPYIQRNNANFRNYKLETVAQKILGEGKLDVTPKEMFRVFREQREMRRRREVGPAWDQLCRDMGRIVDYCLIDSLLVMRIFEKNHVWTELVEFSAIMGVPIGTLYTRGQQVRVFSQIVDAAYAGGYVIDKQVWPALQVAGAIVQETLRGVWDHVMTLDFSSLYPSILIAYNICFTTMIPKHLYGTIPKAESNVFEISQLEAVNPDVEAEHILLEEPDDEPKSELNEAGLVRLEVTEVKKGKKSDTEMHVVDREVRFVRKEVREGIVPGILRRLIAERKATKNLMKAEKPGSFEYSRLDKRQAALKVTANALYGFLGCQKNGMLPLPEGFICVTTRGRELITTVKKYIIDTHPGAVIVAGDTDSLMFTVPGVTGPACHALGKALEKATSTMFPPPIAMEYEKCMRGLFEKKKMYAYLKYDKSGEKFELDEHTGRPDITMKGIRSARRDNCSFQVDLYTENLERLLDLCPPNEILRDAAKRIGALVGGQVPLEALSINTGTKIYSSTSEAPVKVLMDTMAALNKPITAGDRVDYLVRARERDEPDTVAPRMLELGWVLELPEAERPPLDIPYYIEKAVASFDSLAQVAVLTWAGTSEQRRKVLSETELVIPGTRRAVLATLETPIRFLALALKTFTRTKTPERVDMIARWAAWVDHLMRTERSGKWNALTGEPQATINFVSLGRKK